MLILDFVLQHYSALNSMGYIYSQNRNIGSQYLTDNRVYGLSFSTPNISKKQGTIAIKPFYANFKFFE
jgi:hypothetical protein